ncbi:putative ferric reductase [Dysgonomonas hofstadii]|uniref:Putative ferric reductase n=1 Tax=Dysgonomonas hofstadii TaxID=637886 RepID=A0A840CSA0_9BACT|nr:hypothetical protein [Dysgonomonas hofstadii]MBB4037549.1 putative ferric reductase [Dysgonomonas hofstadii]
MEGYKKYRTIHRIAYIVFFFYLLLLAMSDINFGLKNGEMPYHIIVPFIIYCVIAASAEILIRKEIKEKNDKKENEIKYTKLSGI